VGGGGLVPAFPLSVDPNFDDGILGRFTNFFFQNINILTFINKNASTSGAPLDSTGEDFRPLPPQAPFTHSKYTTAVKYDQTQHIQCIQMACICGNFFLVTECGTSLLI